MNGGARRLAFIQKCDRMVRSVDTITILSKIGSEGGSIPEELMTFQLEMMESQGIERKFEHQPPLSPFNPTRWTCRAL